MTGLLNLATTVRIETPKGVFIRETVQSNGQVKFHAMAIPAERVAAVAVAETALVDDEALFSDWRRNRMPTLLGLQMERFAEAKLIEAGSESRRARWWESNGRALKAAEAHVSAVASHSSTVAIEYDRRIVGDFHYLLFMLYGYPRIDVARQQPSADLRQVTVVRIEGDVAVAVVRPQAFCILQLHRRRIRSWIRRRIVRLRSFLRRRRRG